MTRILARGILFDMDGVLVDSTPAVARVWSRWAAKQNLDPVQTVKFAHGRTSLASIQDLLPHLSHEDHLRENRWMEQAEIEDVADVVALPGAAALLAALPASQFAVVTSATRALAEVRLRASGLLPFVRQMITATDIQRGKPDPEPYLKGAALLAFPPSDCLVVEDAASGIRSGKAAGARAIGLRTTTADAELLAAGADWVVNDCSSLHVLSDAAQGNFTLDLIESSALRRTPKMS